MVKVGYFLIVFEDYKKIIPVAVILLSISCFSVANGNNLNKLIEIQKKHHATLPVFVMDMLIDPSMRRVEKIVDQNYIDGLPSIKGGKEWKCLADALYFEARGESVMGQFAVAEVIVNRASSSKFPDTVCGVVKQGTNKSRYRCQFTFMCDGLLESIDDKSSYARAGKIAHMTLWDININLTNGALYYHAKSVNPSWAKKLARTETIGDHKFYSDTSLAN